MSGADRPTPVDVLIITAADAEDKAVRLVEDGALGEWQETPGPPDYGFAVWKNRYRAADGGALTIALSRTVEMGGDAAAHAAARLVDAYKPRCLAMCGVCAGNPERVQLGDVIIADRVWRYDVGEQLNPTEGAKPEFLADTVTYQVKAQWKQAAEGFSPASVSSWVPERPRERELQASWILRELLEDRDPLDSPDRDNFCSDWTDVIEYLEHEELISIKSGRAALTKRGRDQIEEFLFKQGGQLPEPATWKLVVGPMGTGNNLVKDVDIWERLGRTQRHVVGIDMEGSVIGFAAHVHDLPHVVVKGVMDYAKPGRTQGFRLFAARAAAEVLIGFLRHQLEKATEILDPNIREVPPGVSNPGTLLNARYQIVPFFDDIRRSEMDALESWCGETRPTSARLFFGPGGAGKTRLLIEWAKRLRGHGWNAGFLGERVTEQELDDLLVAEHPTLVIVDYAESRPDLLTLLRRVARRGNRGESFRLALLSREVGDWWQVMRTQDADVDHLLTEYEPLRLALVPLEGTNRQEVFKQACHAFAQVRGKSVPQREVDLEDARFGRMLYLHMAALAAVDELPISASSLLEDTVSHEQRYWSKQFAEKYASRSLDRSKFTAGARRTVAAITLLGGVPTIDAAEELKACIAGPDEDQFCSLVSWLYPGRDEIGVQDRFIRGLDRAVARRGRCGAVTGSLRRRLDTGCRNRPCTTRRGAERAGAAGGGPPGGRGSGGALPGVSRRPHHPLALRPILLLESVRQNIVLVKAQTSRLAV